MGIFDTRGDDPSSNTPRNVLNRNPISNFSVIAGIIILIIFIIVFVFVV